MASQVTEEGSCYEWPSYIQSYHNYKEVWPFPTLGVMLHLKVEPMNPQDHFAVAMIKVVGHIPKHASRAVSFFLKKAGSAGFCKISGSRINRGVGLGLEIPCTYNFYGHQT